jgi:2-polyprenyl-3-methyl-5-hydroxy-6-metoxy-1,4-benzoquinol methylase
MAITSLVNALPEVYQPIYGHPEYDSRAARPCADRLRLIISIYERLAGEIGRTPRVLDLGCAQGYFSLQLAALGATVRGVDRLDQNIRLCQTLAEKHPTYSVQFQVASIEDVIEALVPGDVDLVLGMSVVHHICAERGAEQTRALLKELSRKIDIGVFEVALKEEPPEWAARQPDTPDWLYQDFAFLAPVGEFATHLSEQTRPIYFASNKFWWSNGAITRFREWDAVAHEFDHVSNDRGRRYFHTEDRFLKLFRLYGPHGDLNKKELEREVDVLSRPDAAALGFPKLIDQFVGKHEGWVLRERMAGTILSTCLFSGEAPDRAAIAGDLLRQLAALEAVGLFHGDLRAWNILVRNDGSTTLIDYGSISRERNDHEYPQDWRIPLLILLHQLFRPRDDLCWPPKFADLYPAHLPDPAANLVWKLWNDPPHAWTWARIASEWDETLPAQTPPGALSLAENLRLAIDKQTQGLAARIATLETELEAVNKRFRKWDKRLAFLGPVLRLVGSLFPTEAPTGAIPMKDDRTQKASCRVCLHGASRLYAGPNWDGHPHYALLQCSSCNSVFSDPMPTDENLSNLYQVSFDYRWYRDHYAAKLTDCRTRVKEYAPLLGKRVLDFGGGMGYFSQAAIEAGLESKTFDPYVTAARPTTGNWDSVVALHVLEHSNDLDRTMSEMKNFLCPEGRLILAVPNFASLGYKERGMAWVWAQPPLVHIFHFTAAGLAALLARHGFSDIRASYHERWDANLFCDLEHAQRFQKWDRAWGIRPLNNLGLYRRLIAHLNSKRRFRGLAQSLRNLDRASDIYSELQITAVLQRR